MYFETLAAKRETSFSRAECLLNPLSRSQKIITAGSEKVSQIRNLGDERDLRDRPQAKLILVDGCDEVELPLDYAITRLMSDFFQLFYGEAGFS
jgi:hypothetical protein